jgi:hypothetical protein
MAIPTTMADLFVARDSNSPAGSEAVFPNNDEFLRITQAILRRTNAKGTNLASSSTVAIGASTTGDFIDITGTSTINNFDSIDAGIERVVRFTGALTLTHSANIILPSGLNIVTQANDVASFRSLGGGVWVCAGFSGSLLNRTNTFTQAQTISVSGANTLSATSSAAGDSALEMANTNATGRAIIAARNTANANAVLFAGYTSAGYAGSMNIGAGTFSFTTGGNTFYTVYSALRHDFNVGAGQPVVFTWATGNHYFESVSGWSSHSFTASGVVGYLGWTGTQFLASTIVSVSDSREKEEITPIADCLAKACAIEPVSFKYKGKSNTQLGVIAQQVMPIVPDAVISYQKPEEDQRYAVDYSGLLVVCFGAIKELKAEIDILKTRVAALEAA